MTRPRNDLAPLRALWAAQIVADPSLPGRSAGLCRAIGKIARALQRGPRRLAVSERAAVVAALKASLAGPRDFTGSDYNDRLDRCLARASVDQSVCELVVLLGGCCAPLAPELAAILAGTRVSPCTPACCNAGGVAQVQREARSAAVRALAAVGPRGLALVPAAALLPIFAARERRVGRDAAALLARHVAATPALVAVVIAACQSTPVDADPWVCADLCRAIARAGRQLSKQQLGEARRWVTGLRRHERPQVRAAALRALAALGEQVDTGLRDPAAAVRYAALRALGRSTRELCRRDQRGAAARNSGGRR